MLPHSTIGGTRSHDSHYACVIYDKQTGKIHHVHQVINLPGAKVPTPEEMEHSARRYAPKDTPQGLSVVLISSPQLERGKSYRVDHVKQALVAESRN